MSLFVRDRHFYERFFSLTMTIALQNVVVFAVNLADNVMLGRFSEPALAGVALVNQIQFFLQMLVLGVGDGIVVMAARSWGREEIEPIRRLAAIGMQLGMLLTLCLWAVAFFAPSQTLRLFSGDEAVLGQGVIYLRVVCLSYPFFCVTNILLSALRGVETVRIGFIISLSTLVINVTLNYVLIFGHFGAPAMGVAGAAAATLISRVTETVIAVVYTRFADRKIGLRLCDFFRTDRALLREYLKIGSPVLLSNATWGLAMAVQTAILGHMGSTAISANSIATTVFQILTVIVYGSGSAAGVLISKTIGEGESALARAYARTLQILFLLIGAATGLLLFVCRGAVVAFYEVSPESKAMTLQFLAVLSVTVVGTAYQMPVLTGIVRGGGDTRFVLINDMIFMWGIVLPLSAAAAFWLRLPPLAVFVCLKSDQIIKCAVAFVKVNRGRWIRDWSA